MRCCRGLALLFALAPAVSGCEPAPEPEPDPTELESTVVALSPTQHLVRASMALRGMRPSVDELSRVDADPEQLGPIVDAYLESPEFGRTIRDLHDESLLLRPDWLYYPAGFPNVEPLGALDLGVINKSVLEAPLELIEDVVMHDQPYTDIVTADYAMTNPVGARVWGLPYDDDGPEWQRTRYEDGRGNAGILTDSWLYVRFQSTPSNANRQRANAISRGLLCYDFLSRDVDLDTSVDVSDPNVVQDAVSQNAACASCHQALDPLASFFRDMFPITVPGEVAAYPVQNMYLPGVFEDLLGIDMRAPSFFGKPGETLEDLGAMIAEDPRFSLCAAKRFYAYFNQVPLEAVPLERAAELQDVLETSGMSAKALAKAVVLSEDFAASYATTDEEADGLVGMKKARPDELATMFRDLTGFVWETDLTAYTGGLIGRVELPRDTMIGYRVIGGGTDAAYVTAGTFTDNVGTSLVLRGFAEEAAPRVVESDFAEPDRSKRKLLTLVDDDTTSADEVKAQIALLVTRIYGELVEPESDEVGRAYALFQSAATTSASVRRAWTVLLVAMLQDPRVSYY